MSNLSSKKQPSNNRSDLLRQFCDDESGATAIEYGIIVSLIFLAIVGAVRQYTSSASSMYSEISSALD